MHWCKEEVTVNAYSCYLNAKELSKVPKLFTQGITWVRNSLLYAV